MKKYNYLPNILGALGIIFALLMFEMLIAVVFLELGISYEYGDPAASVIQVFAFGIVLTVLMHYSGITYSELFHPSTNSVSATLKLLVLPVSMFCISSVWWLTDILAALVAVYPPDADTLEMFERLIFSGVVSLIAVCVIAPFLEEMLFRGIILRGLLGSYSPIKSILISAFLFGFVHFNIYQFVAAFILGCFLGWIFYLSRSLWPCIFAHAIYNGTTYLPTMSNDQVEFGSPFESFIAIAFSLLAIYLIHRIFSYKSQANS